MPEIAFLFDPPEPLKVACSMQCALQSLQTPAHCCRGHEARTETGPHREQYFAEFFPKANLIIENNFKEIVHKYRHNVSHSQCLVSAEWSPLQLAGGWCLQHASSGPASPRLQHAAPTAATAGPGCSSSWILSLINQEPEVTSPPPRPTPAS